MEVTVARGRYEQRVVVVSADDRSQPDEGVEIMNNLLADGFTALTTIRVKEGTLLLLLEKGKYPAEGEEWKAGYDDDDIDD